MYPAHEYANPLSLLGKYSFVTPHKNHKITVLSTVTKHTGPHHGMELYHPLLGSNSYR